MSFVSPDELEIGQLYDVDLNGRTIEGEFTSRLKNIVPDGDDYSGYIEFENGVSLSEFSECRFWRHG